MSPIYILIAITALNAVFLIVLAVLQINNGRYILKIELATNSMKDALIAAASREGVTEGLRQAQTEK